MAISIIINVMAGNVYWIMCISNESNEIIGVMSVMVMWHVICLM
jgi:hypothetical protein